MSNEVSEGMGIAVIGMAGRFPGAGSISEFWDNLVSGKDVLSVFTDEELGQHVPAELLRKEHYVKAGYVLDKVDGFDAAFFGYTPAEARTIDPQQRLFLECAWEAFEDAGHVPGREKSVGVFASITPSSYLPFDTSQFPGSEGRFFENLLGNDKDYAAARVAYKLDLKGPAFSVQSACSSSLVGICVACQALLDSQCDMALAGGASITLPEKTGYLSQEEGGFSLDGRCHAFDHRASGMNSGNGVAVVLLKRLEDAVADGDHIYGVIRGFAVNNDGSDKVGFIAPSVHGQRDVISEALAISGFDPGTISYVEAHGTGTPLGDPMEMRALVDAYGKEGLPCALASVKTNIGHLNSAAGAAGLIRALLNLEHRTLTPLLNFEKANPEIPFEETRFYPNTECKPWTETPLRAGVSSFGLGGTNAHVLLEEAPTVAQESENREAWHLIPLSARSEAALDQQTQRLRDSFKAHGEMNLSALAYTLQTGRTCLPHRAFLVCRDREDLAKLLEEGRWDRQNREPGKSQEKKLFFLFPGAGSEYAGMGRGLYEEEAVFREQVDKLAEIFKPLLNFDIRTIICAKEDDAVANEVLHGTAGMAALFAVEYALARLWMHWGVEPSGCGGHSFGQYVAAVLCGVFSLEDAARVVVTRCRLMEKVQPGGMLVLFAPEESAQALLSGTLSLASVNTGTLCTVAGSPEDIDALENRLTEERIRFRRVPVERAGHNCLMEPILEEFKGIMQSVPMQAPSLPLLSNVSGSWMTAEEAVSAESWTVHIRQTVRFAENLATLLQEPDAILLEAGPGNGLVAFARRHADMQTSHAAVASLRGAGDTPVEDGLSVRKAYGQLFLAGFNPDWFRGNYAQGHPVRLSLPTYPFEHESFWADRAAGTVSGGRGDVELMRSLMDKQEDSEKWYFLPVWKRDRRLAALSAGEGGALPDDWLVFLDGIGLGEAVASRLESLGKRVGRVKPGSAFAKEGLTFTLNPTEEKEYVTLLQALQGSRLTPGHIVHAWSLTPDETLGQGLAFYESSKVLGYSSLICLVRALSAASLGQSAISIGVISNHLQSVSGAERLSPEKALVLGPCRVIPSEFLHVQTMSIDVETPAAGAIRPAVVDTLIRDLATIPHQDPGRMGDLSDTFRSTVAYRGSHRWEQNFDRVRLTPPSPEDVPLKEEGVYLVTGGFGGVAYELSKHLAKTRRARLVLTGRTPVPPRAEWDNWLAGHEAEDAVAKRILQVRELEAEGAQVLAVSADVADAAAMKAAWDEAVRTFGKIDGVFHTASMATSSMIQAQTEERAYTVISPKVHGTLILDELAGDSLDFLMLFSSISSHVGALGHTDYTAACLFMDTFAQMKGQQGDRSHTKVVAVNWGYWDGVGIGVQLLPKLVELMGDDVPVRGIRPAEGMQCVERALCAPVEQLIVSTSNYSVLVATFLNSVKRALTDYGSFHAKKTTISRPNLATPFRAPGNAVEEVVCIVWQELFGIEGIGVDDTFIDLGGDSLHALPMISKLEEIFRIKVPIRSLLEENTVAKISAYLMANESKPGQALLIAKMFMKVRNMSPEEVQRMLAEKKQAQQGK